MCVVNCRPPSRLLPAAYHKKNCTSNPHCLYGLGEGVKGIWAKKPALLSSLGPNPRLARRDPRVKPAGLINNGATCYLNSLLQVLFMNLPFRAAIYAWRPPAHQREAYDRACRGLEAPAGPARSEHTTAEEREADDCRDMAALQRLFAFLQCSAQRSYNPSAFIHIFGIDVGVQQDVQEFWTMLMGHFERVCERSGHLPPPLQSVIPDLFRGRSRFVAQCSFCGRASSNESVFYDLQASAVPLAGCSVWLC